MKLLSIGGHFFIQRSIKKGLLMLIEHNLQIDDQKILPNYENGHRIPLFTIPINIGENTFTVLCLLEHRGSVQQCFIHHPFMPTVT